MSKKRGRMGNVGWLLIGLLVVGAGTAVWYGNRLIGQSTDRLLYPQHTQPIPCGQPLPGQPGQTIDQLRICMIGHAGT